MDDDELIAAVAAGDDCALRELFSRHAAWLAPRLRSVLSIADVEDVLQETLPPGLPERGQVPTRRRCGWLEVGSRTPVVLAPARSAMVAQQ